jgi:hypothetical protein
MKPLLSEKEAAEFCCCSTNHFVNKIQPNLNPINFFGKKVFRSAEILALAEHAPAWRGGSKKSAFQEEFDRASIAEFMAEIS